MEPELVGGLFGIGLVVLLWWATWNSAKKRKIGLAITSYIALFLTPLIAFFMTLFTEKINKTQDQPTYQQRLKYENTTAMLIAEILYIVFSVLALVVGIIGCFYGRSGLAGCINFAILLTWGISLFFERKELLRAKNEETENVLADESESLVQNPYSENGETLKPSFVLESNVQRRITIGTDNVDTSKASRNIIVEHNGGDRYTLSILDGESGKVVLQSVQMHRVSYSKIDECLSMVSDDNKGEYALNVFYKDGQVYKCVVQRKSKNVYIHYDKE